MPYNAEDLAYKFNDGTFGFDCNVGKLADAGFQLSNAQIGIMNSKKGHRIRFRNDFFPDDTFTNRPSHIDSLLIQSRGGVSTGGKACDRCRAGKGHFKDCRYIRGAYDNGCGNCKFDDRSCSNGRSLKTQEKIGNSVQNEKYKPEEHLDREDRKRRRDGLPTRAEEREAEMEAQREAEELAAAEEEDDDDEDFHDAQE